jgi:ribonuclease Z
LFHEELFPVMPSYEWQSAQPTTTLANGASVRAFQLNHPGGCLGFRLDYQGKSLAYVTDTTASDGVDYVSAIRGVDVLLHECNFPDGHADLAEKTGHSCLSQVAHVAAAAQVKRLVLIHFDPVLEVQANEVAAARKIFAAIEAGCDGMELVV